MYAMTEVYSKKITITNSKQSINAALSSLEDFAQSNDIPSNIVDKVNNILNELLSNIITFSFPLNENQEINIILELQNTGKLSIQIKHKGLPFNPFQICPPDFNTPIEEREVGGFGIYLVKKLMDEYSYQRDFDCNVTMMCKNQI